jgi:hypothetical protein
MKTVNIKIKMYNEVFKTSDRCERHVFTCKFSISYSEYNRESPKITRDVVLPHVQYPKLVKMMCKVLWWSFWMKFVSSFTVSHFFWLYHWTWISWFLCFSFFTVRAAIYCDMTRIAIMSVQRMGTSACFVNMSHGFMDSKVIIYRLDVQSLISSRGLDISLWPYVETGSGDHAASCLKERDSTL